MTDSTGSSSSRRALTAVAVLVAFVAVMKFSTTRHTKAVYCEKDLKPMADTVVMLGASWCGYCARTRDHLASRKIQYCEYDIEQSAEGASRYRAAGAGGIPIIFIKHDRLLGFDAEALDAALAANGVHPVKPSTK
ncbi:MAG: glutaredoxin family protein [Gammaproteobacteria bacterium]|nr:glutaredoxin family protein [Gammaproteobacteria bacterium]